MSRLRKARRTLLFRHILVTLLAVCIMGFFATITVLAKPLDPIKRAIKDFSFTDIYYEILSETGDAEECPYITIVDLTNLTDRSDIAATILDIENANPKVLGIDAVFDNEGEDYEANDSLIMIADSCKNIMWALKALDYTNDSIGHTKEIHSFFAYITDITEGTTNMPRGKYDSMKRTLPMGEKVNGKFKNSFVIQVCNMFAGKDFRKDRTSDININFTPTKFTKLSPEQVKKHPELIHDRIVLLGSLYEDADWHWTPVDKIAGVELLAYSISTVIGSKEIQNVSFLPFCVLSLFIVLFVQVVQSKYLKRTSVSRNMFIKYVMGSSYIMGIITFLCTSLFIGVSFLVFKLYNISFNLAWAISVIAFLGTSRSMYDAIRNYLQSIAEKHPKFKKYLI